MSERGAGVEAMTSDELRALRLQSYAVSHGYRSFAEMMADEANELCRRRQPRKFEAPQGCVFVNGIGWTNNPPVKRPGEPLVGVVIGNRLGAA